MQIRLTPEEEQELLKTPIHVNFECWIGGIYAFIERLDDDEEYMANLRYKDRLFHVGFFDPDEGELEVRIKHVRNRR